MRVPAAVVIVASAAAVLPAMSMPISSETYDMYAREAPAQGSGALGLGTLFKIGRHLIPHHSSGSSNSNGNNGQNKKHRRELEELFSREEFIDLLAREMEADEMYAREAPAQGSGALGLGLLFKIGRHLIPHSSNNNKHRRDLEEVDLWERDMPEESLWERELPEEEFWARDVPEQEFWERDVPEQELWEREVPAAAEGSGALGFGLVKDVFKVGAHLFGHSGGSSGSNNNQNNPKHRRSDEFDDLFARDYEYTYEWE